MRIWQHSLGVSLLAGASAVFATVFGTVLIVSSHTGAGRVLGVVLIVVGVSVPLLVVTSYAQVSDSGLSWRTMGRRHALPWEQVADIRQAPPDRPDWTVFLNRSLRREWRHYTVVTKADGQRVRPFALWWFTDEEQPSGFVAPLDPTARERFVTAAQSHLGRRAGQ